MGSYLASLPPFAALRIIIGVDLPYGVAETNHFIGRAAQAARGRGITFRKAVKSLLSLRDPDDKVVRAVLPSGYSITVIKIPCLVSQKDDPWKNLYWKIGETPVQFAVDKAHPKV